LSLNNPQTTETNFCEKYEIDMLKIIIIMIGYTLNNFFTQMIIDHGKNNNFKIEKKELIF
jgi:hypothetical protein